MKPVVKYNHWVPKLVSRWMVISAITLWPYILFSGKKCLAQDRTLRHEGIHMSQYNECWVLGFLVLYCWDYLVCRVRGFNHMQSYLAIRFEQEAFDYDAFPEYSRKRFAWAEYKLPRKVK